MRRKYPLLIAALLLAFNFGCSNPDESTSSSTDSLPLASTGNLVAINGTELFVREMGKGEPIIVIHGGPVLEHGYLLPHLEKLTEHFRLIFFDQRLSGRSSADVATEDVTFENFLGDIEALRVYAGESTVHIMGHSWGGLLAMMYAVSYPEQTRSLMLISSMPASWDDWQEENRRLAAITPEYDKADRQRVMESEAFAEQSVSAIEELYRISFRSQFYDRTKVDDLAFYIPPDLTARSQHFSVLMPAMQGYDLYESLGSITVPALVLYGAAEPAASLSGLKIRDAISGSVLRVIPNAGHFSFVESPTEFRNAVEQFLTGRLQS